MNDAGLHFHHLGLAVREQASARRFLESLGYDPGEAVFDPEQNVRLIMYTHQAMPDVEVICPGGEGRSPVDSLASRHKNGIVYHLCYHSSDVAASVAAVERAGIHVICVSPPKPAVLFGGRHVSFYMVDGMGLIEILEQVA